jgi:hypothetical protein
MKHKFKNVLIGLTLSIIVVSIIIYSIENKKSIVQIIIGFIIFIFPITFISSFYSKIGSFLLGSLILVTGYLIFKFMIDDFCIGGI